jgi:hypothetical protein
VHPSDILVLGPLPLVGRSVRLPLGTALAGLLALVLASATTLIALDAPVATPIRGLASRLAGTPNAQRAQTPVAGALIPLTSAPMGAEILADGQVLGTTPATIPVPAGHPLVLRRPGAPDVTLLEPRADVAIPVWPPATVLPVRAPVPGGAVRKLSTPVRQTARGLTVGGCPPGM